MITTVFLYIIYGVLLVITSPIRLLADVTTVSTFSAGVVTASSYLKGLNAFLPVTEILAVLFIVLVYEAGYFSFKVIYWVIKRIPTQS